MQGQVGDTDNIMCKGSLPMHINILQFGINIRICNVYGNIKYITGAFYVIPLDA